MKTPTNIRLSKRVKEVFERVSGRMREIAANGDDPPPTTAEIAETAFQIADEFLSGRLNQNLIEQQTPIWQQRFADWQQGAEAQMRVQYEALYRRNVYGYVQAVLNDLFGEGVVTLRLNESGLLEDVAFDEDREASPSVEPKRAAEVLRVHRLQ